MVMNLEGTLRPIMLMLCRHDKLNAKVKIKHGPILIMSFSKEIRTSEVQLWFVYQN